ncbi:MAG: SRPBCC family protein [Acidimicrobiales bacterium]
MPLTSERRALIELPADDQILITREFDAPRDRLYKAYTDPALLRRWWCGQRGVVTLCEIDLRVGGAWRYVLEANGGFEVAFHGVYQEIVPEERLVSTEVFEAVPDSESFSTVTFEEYEGRTMVRILVQHGSQAMRDMHLQSGMEGGLNEALDLLEELAGGTEQLWGGWSSPLPPRTTGTPRSGRTWQAGPDRT